MGFQASAGQTRNPRSERWKEEPGPSPLWVGRLGSWGPGRKALWGACGSGRGPFSIPTAGVWAGAGEGRPDPSDPKGLGLGGRRPGSNPGWLCVLRGGSFLPSLSLAQMSSGLEDEPDDPRGPSRSYRLCFLFCVRQTRGHCNPRPR